MLTLTNENCLDLMARLDDNSIDAIVTDPPYGLAFMGKKWDYDVPSIEIWQECLRVLKPGGHLLAFAGTRTQHRMAVRIEDAGFEIRDIIMWVYGSGFPKSHDISKAIDKAAGAEREVVGTRKFSATNSANFRDDGWVPNLEKLSQITAPATPEAQQWDGWGTALKPAVEPITVARKPLQGTVAENVLTWGTGGINIDGCRVEVTKESAEIDIKRRGYKNGLNHVCTPKQEGQTWEGWGMKSQKHNTLEFINKGRFPANLIHDGSEEVMGMFPDTGAGAIPKGKFKIDSKNGIYGKFNERENKERVEFDSGSAARFFYQAKADKGERGQGNTHPTVKPVDLMRYLCRLVTPPGGTILEPFAGSGTTLIAAHEEGFSAIGCELSEEYYNMAQERIKAHTAQQKLF